jgi:prepilin-type N-terminal cleavage/methylation domain-containing protein
MMKIKSRARAFSLVELVIVVVIIGVIAAIAVPRISRGAKGAGESALRGSLASLRNSIDMYAAEHTGAWPGVLGADHTAPTLLSQLTKKTNSAGVEGTTAGVHIFGPYLRGGFPPAPVGPNMGETGVIMTATVPIATAADEAQTTMGWVYNYETGEIIVNTADATKDEKARSYNTY